MKQRNHGTRRIQILRDTVAQKIAAGEVIDRPFSVVRELLDNSIDAGSDSIELHLESGGLKRIRLLDNGAGMDREDLELCFRPHATSKISSVNDIYNLHTLGFRGEALASIAACAKLTITSAPPEGRPHTLEVRNGSAIRLEESRGTPGTIIDVADLFYAMPGRKKFLKSPGAESAACKRTFLEKAIPFPDIQFRYFTDGELKLFLPQTSLSRRIVMAFKEQIQEQFLTEVESEAGRFRFKAVLSSPSHYRRDRRYIHIYVNKRRIQEYSLVQAVQYAYEELLPGGSFPIAFIFLEIDPDLVDFNIHPAKREVKIKNLPEIHHELVHTLKSHLNSQYSVPSNWSPKASPDRPLEFSAFSPPTQFSPRSGSAFDGRKTGRSDKSSLRDGELERWKNFAAESPGRSSQNEMAAPSTRSPEAFEPRTGTDLENPANDSPSGGTGVAQGELRYLGQAFNLFLIIQVGQELFLIDQHAAHERILFNQITEGPRNIQALLVPFDFQLEEDEERVLEKRLSEYKDVGIYLEKSSPGNWTITHLPVRFSGFEEYIVDSLKEQSDTDSGFKAHLFADLACKAAVKDGEPLDQYSALELATQALALPVPRCPHGRPIWLRLSREELFQVVGRT